MIHHLSDEELICFIDNEPSPSKPARSHLEACSKCRNQLQELLSKTEQFEQLMAQIIPREFPHSDFHVSQLHRRLAELPVVEKTISRSTYNSGRAFENSVGPTSERGSDHMTTKLSFKLLRLPKQGRHFRIPLTCGVTYTDGDKLFRAGHQAYAQDSVKQAIEYWRQAKIVFLRLDLSKEIAACDRNMAVAQTQLGQSEQALEQFKKAKSLFKKIGDIKAVNSCDLKIRELLRETTHT
jgi:tetratricopeptide (TPR) repeat protein